MFLETKNWDGVQVRSLESGIENCEMMGMSYPVWLNCSAVCSSACLLGRITNCAGYCKPIGICRGGYFSMYSSLLKMLVLRHLDLREMHPV